MSDSSPRYDPELQAFLEDNPDIDRSSLAPEGIAPLRQQFVSLGLEGLVTGRNLEATESHVRARDGHEFPMTTIRPTGSSSPSAAIFHIHSGGMIALRSLQRVSLPSVSSLSHWDWRASLQVATSRQLNLTLERATVMSFP